MKIKKNKGIDGKLDVAWAKLVKLRAGNECEYCGTTSKKLDSHHIFSRQNKATRWDVNNGIALCASHHVFSSSFSAHKTPMEFTEWLISQKGQDFVTRLRIKSKSISKLHAFEKEILLKELEKEIVRLEK